MEKAGESAGLMIWDGEGQMAYFVHGIMDGSMGWQGSLGKE